MQKLILTNLHHLNAQSVVPSVKGVIYCTLLIIHVLSSTAVATVLLKWWWKMIKCYEKQKLDFNVVKQWGYMGCGAMGWAAWVSDQLYK